MNKNFTSHQTLQLCVIIFYENLILYDNLAREVTIEVDKKLRFSVILIEFMGFFFNHFEINTLMK